MNETEENIKTEVQDFGKCAICLQKFPSHSSKSYTSKCFHSFCFECLLEWSKVKYSCPLCKTDFDRIVYDVQTRLDFKSYFLKLKEIENLPDVVAFSPNAPQLQVQQYSKASWVANSEQAPIEFRMLVYKNNWYVNMNQVQTDVIQSNIDLDENETISESLNCISYKVLYRFRDTRPEWFEQNPACTHRIMLFLYRELKAISGITPSSSSDRLVHALRSQLLCIIVKLIKKYEIKSEKFYQEISEYIRPLKYARHFQHELHSFAKSTCSDLIEYDSKCVYYKEDSGLPKENEMDMSKIIPFHSLPVNLSKYRLLKKEGSDLASYYDNYEQTVQEIQPSTSRSVEERVLSDTDQSSFCEVVSPPRKQTPPLIEIDSSDNECSSVQSRSVTSTTKRISKRKSRSRSRSRTRRHKKKHKKESRHKHKKKKSHKKSSKSKSRRRKKRSRTRSRSRARRSSNDSKSTSPKRNESEEKERNFLTSPKSDTQLEE